MEVQETYKAQVIVQLNSFNPLKICSQAEFD